MGQFNVSELGGGEKLKPPKPAASKPVKRATQPDGAISSIVPIKPKNHSEQPVWPIKKNLSRGPQGSLNCEATNSPDGHKSPMCDNCKAAGNKGDNCTHASHFVVTPGDTEEGMWPVCAKHHAEFNAGVSRSGKRQDWDIPSKLITKNDIENYRVLKTAHKQIVRTGIEQALQAKGATGEDALFARKKETVGPGRPTKVQPPSSSGASVAGLTSGIEGNTSLGESSRPLSWRERKAKAEKDPEHYDERGRIYNFKQPESDPKTGTYFRTVADHEANEKRASADRINRVLEFHKAGNEDVFGKAKELGLSDNEMQDAREQIDIHDTGRGRQGGHYAHTRTTRERTGVIPTTPSKKSTKASIPLNSNLGLDVVVDGTEGKGLPIRAVHKEEAFKRAAINLHTEHEGQRQAEATEDAEGDRLRRIEGRRRGTKAIGASRNTEFQGSSHEELEAEANRILGLE